jgi:DNA modification methylase
MKPYYESDNIAIYHGDCLTIMPTLPAKSIDMILCDLPYQITACRWDTLIPFEPLWKEYRRLIKDNGAIVLTGSQPFTSMLIMSNLPWFRYEWIWAKSKATGHLDSKRKPLKAHENILVFYDKQSTYNPQMVKGEVHHRGQKAQSKQTEVYGKFRFDLYYSDEYYPKSIQFENVQERATHPTQKPVALFEYLIKTYTNEGDTIMDNCSGSGTSGVACQNTGRKCIQIEQELEYVEIAVKRLSQSVFDFT